MKLIFEQYFTDGCTYGNTVPIPFEYTSKEDFVLEVLERILEAKNDANDSGEECIEVKFLGLELVLGTSIFEEDIEKNIYTVEEWFEKEKVKF